jgi:adenylate kinase family enzyme
VARALAERLGLRYVSNDALIWGPNWQEVPRDRRYEAFDRETLEGGWTFDGNLGPSPEDELVLSRCDTLVWLDLPRWQVMATITVRTLWRATTRERLWHDNVERWRNVFSSDSMIAWARRTYPGRKEQYAGLFADTAHAGRSRIRLRSRGEVATWLKGVTKKSAT